MDILADAVWSPTLEEAEVGRERGVILAEIDRSMDQPDQLLQHHLFLNAYGASHPYGRPIMGSRKSVGRFGAGMLRWFHRRAYDPARSVVVVSGNVSRGALLKVLREKLRGGGARFRPPKKSTPIKIPPASPEKEGPRVFALRGRSGLAQLEIAFPVPSLRHPDAPALEVLAMILGMGESSRLFKRLCVETSLMHEVSAENFFSLGEGLLFLGGTSDPDDVGEAASEIIRVAREIAGGAPPQKDELERARLNFISDMEFRRESTGGWGSIAAYARLLVDDARFADAYLRRLLGVGGEDVQRVAGKYLRHSEMTAGAFLPLRAKALGGARALRRAIKDGFSEQAGISEKKDGPAKAPPASPPEVSLTAGRRKRGPRWRVFESLLPGGMRLIVQPGGAARVFTIRAVCLGGQRLEGKKAGLHGLMSNVATQATRSMKSDELAKRVDGLGAVLEGFAGRNSIGISASCISPVSDELLEIVAEVIAAPAFAGGDLDLALREIEADRQSDQDDLAHLSRLRMMALLYGAHPFARHPLGDRRYLSQVAPPALKRAWRRWVAPGNLVISVAGDVDPGEVGKKLKRLLGPWAKNAPAFRPPPAPLPPVPPARGRSRRYAVKGSAQSHIQLAFLGVDFGDPRRHALSVLLTALGSQGGGLFWELRERRGIAYAVYASSEEALDPGPVSFYVATAPGAEEEALEAVRGELEKVRRSGLGAEEFERAKAFLIGERLRALQRAGGRASELAFDALYGLERESREGYRKKIQAVSAEEVLGAARHFLDPGKGALVRLGPPLPKRRRGRN